MIYCHLHLVRICHHLHLIFIFQFFFVICIILNNQKFIMTFIVITLFSFNDDDDGIGEDGVG